MSSPWAWVHRRLPAAADGGMVVHIISARQSESIEVHRHSKVILQQSNIASESLLCVQGFRFARRHWTGHHGEARAMCHRHLGAVMEHAHLAD